MSYITAIGTANPLHRFDQQTIAAFMENSMQLNEYDARKLRTVFKASGINYRYSVLEDYGKVDQFEFFPNQTADTFPSTHKRLNEFTKQALPLSIAAVKQMASGYELYNPATITHLIFVCCTGMYAPGVDVELVKALNLRTTINRTCITFMGCYAAFNALKVADAFCKSDRAAKVLIVCTELCSLHFQKEATDDNILANGLFGDGAAALLIEATNENNKALELRAFHNDLAIEGEEEMAWRVGDLGFQMSLTSYVPDVIRTGIRKLTDSLLLSISKKIEDIKYFAIHPGGKKILETIEKELNIPKERNTAAYKVLKEFGNMSSPTVLFVLQEVFRNLTMQDNGQFILSLAFGPGLTLESMLLTANIKSNG